MPTPTTATRAKKPNGARQTASTHTRDDIPIMSATAGVWAQSWPMLVYNPSQLLMERGGLQLFDSMLLADQIKAAMSFKVESVLATGWSLESPEDQDPEWEVTEFIRRRLTAIPNGFELALRSVMSALSYGYSITEVVYTDILTGEDRGLTGIGAMKTRAPHYLRFKLDEFGDIIGIINDQDGEVYPPRKFTIWSYNSTFGNPYGQSDLESCYRAYILEDNTYRFLGMYLERLGIPPWIALYNPESLDRGQQQDLHAILKNMQNATSAAIPRATPDDFEIWTPGNTGNVQSVFVPAIDMLKRDMARALLMPGHLGVSPDSTQGSLAKARVALDMFLLSITAVQAALREIVQHQLVNPLVDFNFVTNGVYPTFKFVELSSDDAQAICETWSSLVDLDIVNVDLEDEQHIRSLLRFPRRETAEDKGGPIPPGDVDPALARIPFRYLKDVAGAFTKDEVRAAMGYPPLAEGGDELLSKPAAPPPAPQGEEAQGEADDDTDADETADEGEAEPGQEEPAMRRPFAEGRGEPPSRPFAEDDVVVVEDPPLPTSDWPGLTASERRCDFAQIVAGLDGIEDSLVVRVSILLRDMVRQQLAAWQKRPPTLARAPKVKLAFPGQVATAMQRGAKATYNQGRSDTKAELAKAPAAFAGEMPPTYDPTEALQFIETLTDLSVTGMNTAMTAVVRTELMNGLRNGSPYTETASRILDALAPWIGEVVADPAALRPDRILTTVRTLATSAYNVGRIVEARRSAAVGLVTGVQHSSVLDSRTTPICRSLHGTMYKITDPALDKFTPPLHFRCRSIMLPITLDLEVSDDPKDKDHWQTPEERAAAERLVPGGFGGSFTATSTKNTPPK